MNYKIVFLIICFVLIGCGTPESFKQVTSTSIKAQEYIKTQADNVSVIVSDPNISLDNESIRKRIYYLSKEISNTADDTIMMLTPDKMYKGDPAMDLPYSRDNAKIITESAYRDLERYNTVVNLLGAGTSLLNGVVSNFLGIDLDTLMYIISGIFGGGGLGGMYLRERGNRKKAESGLEGMMLSGEEIKENVSLNDKQVQQINDIFKTNVSLKDKYLNNKYYEMKKKRKK